MFSRKGNGLIFDDFGRSKREGEENRETERGDPCKASLALHVIVACKRKATQESRVGAAAISQIGHWKGVGKKVAIPGP